MAGATNATLPLRTGMIGLSASAVTSWAAGAHLPALLHPHGQKNYKITALCNSSVDAAKAAIEAFKLPEDTKAYGSPRDLANDPDIDVVICNTRVDKHYETIVDSVKAGKMVYVEWPVTSSVRQTEELLALAEESGSRVAVGLQGRWAPPVVKLRELIGKEDVGRVLSCEVRAFGGTLNRAGMPVGLKYFGEKAVGGNPITIGFGHSKSPGLVVWSSVADTSDKWSTLFSLWWANLLKGQLMQRHRFNFLRTEHLIRRRRRLWRSSRVMFLISSW